MQSESSEYFHPVSPGAERAASHLNDQVDWETLLVKNAGHADRYGLYGLDRRIHPVGEAYRDLIRTWRSRMTGAQ